MRVKLKTNCMKRFVLTAICVLASAYCALAQFSGAGSGTRSDPYRIFNADQLNQVRNFLNDGDVCFSLEADIDMTQWIAENNPVQGWMPIGTKSSAFSGTFDGNGHTISNLKINRPEMDYAGFFGYINYANISSVTLAGAGYKCRNYVGGIAGYAYYKANILDCSFQGTIVANDDVGGILGKADSYYDVVVDSCTVYMTVLANKNIGGIAGSVDNETTGIFNSYSHSHIRGAENLGGIVGRLNSYYSIRIQDSYSSGSVEGGECVGGIVGNIDSYYGVYRCYSQCASLIGSDYVGGVAGKRSSGDVSSCVAINSMISAGGTNLYRVGPESMSGCTPGTSKENRAWVLTRMIQDDIVLLTPADGVSSGTSVGLSTLRLKATYQGLEWDFDNNWEIQETECFPYLKFQTAPPYFTQSLKAGDMRLEGQCVENGKVTVRVNGKPYTATVENNNWSVDVEPLSGGDDVEITSQAAGKHPSYVVTASVAFAGDGTEESPYLISSARDLQKATSDAYYKLTADIDLADWIATANMGNGWIPVGGDGPALMGRIDGGGHKVTGLVCDSTYSNTGLIAKTAIGASVANLTVAVADGAVVKGSGNVGIVVGHNKGTVTGCGAVGDIGGGTYAGGIAGLNEGKISLCHTDGSITIPGSDEYAGGICGNVASGEVSDSYSSMALAATGTSSYCAGIVGMNSGRVLRCYSSGDVRGYDVSGVVAYNSGDDAVVSGCVALNGRIEATHAGLRVLSGLSAGTSVPAMDNYALDTMVVSVNGKPQTIYDDPMNGAAKTVTELRSARTYRELGWDMDGTWLIDEGYSYPYLLQFNIPVVSVALGQSEIELEKGETVRLAATVMPEDARNGQVEWSSSDENVAVVAADGTVTAIAPGLATIAVTTTDGTGLSAECAVTVLKPSAIGGVEAARASVSAADGAIVVSGVAKGTAVSVYSSDGNLVYSGCGRKVNVGSTGLYIVKVSGEIHKVIVK